MAFIVQVCIDLSSIFEGNQIIITKRPGRAEVWMSFDETAWNDAVRWVWTTARDGLKARAARAACLAALMVVFANWCCSGTPQSLFICFRHHQPLSSNKKVSASTCSRQNNKIPRSLPFRVILKMVNTNDWMMLQIFKCIHQSENVFMRNTTERTSALTSKLISILPT